MYLSSLTQKTTSWRYLLFISYFATLVLVIQTKTAKEIKARSYSEAILEVAVTT